jgi:putative aminopeptidase FrvX
MNHTLLRDLTQADGIPSMEDGVRDVVAVNMSPLVDDLRVDTLGNLVGHVKGNGGLSVAIAAHMDEIGFIVRYVEDNGFIRLQPVGGFDARTLVAQRVSVHAEGGEPLIGVLQPGAKPIHLLQPGDSKELKLEEFFVDLGMPADEVKERVCVGDMVTMRRDFEMIGDVVISKALDDRLGVYVMLEAIKAAGRVDADVYPIATVQEEVGLRGATTAAFGIKPDIAIAVDTTISGDIPGIPSDATVTKLRHGTAIKMFDSSQLPNRKLVAHLREIAESNGIPFQLEVLPRGGTDAGAFQRSQDGIVTATISIPSRYVHTVNEMCAVSDIQASVDLLAQFLREAGSRDYSYDLPSDG